MTDRQFAADVCRTLADAGHVALFAGGCVRDELLGLPPADYDIATSALPADVTRLFRRCVTVGAEFLVVEVLGPRDAAGEWRKVQVATFRRDGAYLNGRSPESVEPSTPPEDAGRRDFTVNGMFLNPATGEVIDYVGGRADLAAKVLRAIGTPADRFREDKLRVLRAVRMAARFGLAVDPATRAAGRAGAGDITGVSAERVADEFRKMLKHPARTRAVGLLADFGLVRPVLPELADPAAWAGGTAAVGRLTERASFELALATLLHMIGKAAADRTALRLKLSNDERARVVWLVDGRAKLTGAASQARSKLFPVLAHPGAAELVALARAVDPSPADADYCDRVLTTTPADVLNPPPLATGDDLIAAGLKPGPRFKPALDAARAAQLDGQVTTPADALALARRRIDLPT